MKNLLLIKILTALQIIFLSSNISAINSDKRKIKNTSFKFDRKMNINDICSSDFIKEYSSKLRYICYNRSCNSYAYKKQDKWYEYLSDKYFLPSSPNIKFINRPKDEKYLKILSCKNEKYNGHVIKPQLNTPLKSFYIYDYLSTKHNEQDLLLTLLSVQITDDLTVEEQNKFIFKKMPHLSNPAQKFDTRDHKYIALRRESIPPL